MKDLLTTTDAAKELGVSRSRILKLIEVGRLPSEKVGMQHLIKRKDLTAVRVRKTGRPPK